MPDAKPRWQQASALHPAKYPGDGTKIFEAACLLTLCRTRSDLHILQFSDWSGLLEIDHGVRVLRNVLAIKRKCRLREFLHRALPLHIVSRFGTVGTYQSLQRRRDH